MKIAHENDFDWVWLLDQDGTVSPNCLMELLKYGEKGDLLCPNKCDQDLALCSRPSVFAKNFFWELVSDHALFIPLQDTNFRNARSIDLKKSNGLNRVYATCFSS